jgi:acetyl esterase/lipase
MLKKWAVRIAVGVELLLLLAVLGIGGGLGYLKLNEARLIFEAEGSHQWTALPAPPPAGVQPVQIATPGGALHGYTMLPADGRDARYWVLHLHGNADSAFSGTQLRNMQRLREQGFAVLAFDYRGFGGSPGTPSEAGLYEDAESGWQWLLAQGVAPGRIIIWGHSLGGGPAVNLAQEHRAAALVLFGAFTSVPDVAMHRYPWLPVRWIAGIHFDSLGRLPGVRMPVVIAHCGTDRVIPWSNAGKLFAVAHEPKRLLELTMPDDDGFGGHVTALYEQLDLLMPLLRELAVVP